MPHDQSDEFEQNLSRQPVRRIPGEWRADILAAARDAQMSRNGSAVTSHSGLSTLSVNQELDLGKGEARPFHELEVGLGHVGSPPSPRPSPPGRGRNAPSVLAICRRWVGVGSGVQCANGSGKSLPGISSPTGVYPSPTGAGEGGRWPDEGHHGRTNPGGEGARRADEGRGDGARFQSPGGAIGNSPPMHRWGFARITRLSPGGRKKCRPQHSLSPLAGLGIYVLGRIPAMNRGAIFGRPCGTGANGRLVEIRGRRISPSGWKFFPVCSRLPNRN
jgi:hypothetical protein